MFWDCLISVLSEINFFDSFWNIKSDFLFQFMVFVLDLVNGLKLDVWEICIRRDNGSSRDHSFINDSCARIIKMCTSIEILVKD